MKTPLDRLMEFDIHKEVAKKRKVRTFLDDMTPAEREAWATNNAKTQAYYWGLELQAEEENAYRIVAEAEARKKRL